MKWILCLMGLLACFGNASAQDYDVWDGTTHPNQHVARSPHTLTTIAQARAAALAYVPVIVREQVDDFMPIVAVKIALLSQYPSSNTATQALLAEAIPTGSSVVQEVRYLAAFKREIDLGYASLRPRVLSNVEAYWNFGNYRRPTDYRFPANDAVTPWITACYNRARQIAYITGELEAWLMPALAADVDFVRDSARVKMGELNGFRFNSRQQNLYVKPKSTDTRKLYTPLRSTWVREFAHVGVGTAGQASFTIVAHGAVECQIGTAAPFAVRDTILWQFSPADVAKGVRISPIDTPSVVTHIANQSVEATTEQTLDYTGTFAGTRLTYAITSSQESVLRVRLGETGIAVLEGVSAGNSTVRLSATNEAGSAVSEFIVTVTARSE